MFFSEEKNQKTFMSLLSLRAWNWPNGLTQEVFSAIDDDGLAGDELGAFANQM